MPVSDCRSIVEKFYSKCMELIKNSIGAYILCFTLVISTDGVLRKILSVLVYCPICYIPYDRIIKCH